MRYLDNVSLNCLWNLIWFFYMTSWHVTEMTSVVFNDRSLNICRIIFLMVTAFLLNLLMQNGPKCMHDFCVKYFNSGNTHAVWLETQYQSSCYHNSCSRCHFLAINFSRVSLLKRCLEMKHVISFKSCYNAFRVFIFVHSLDNISLMLNQIKTQFHKKQIACFITKNLDSSFHYWRDA